MNDQEYYDTQPTNDYGEADVIDGVYEDPTHLPEIDKEITAGIKDSISIKLATWIRQKVYGADVRETMARFILWMSVLYNRILATANKLTNRQTDLEGKFDKLNSKFENQLEGSTSDGEVIDARTSSISGHKYNLLGSRLDAMEESHFTIDYKEVGTLISLQDDRFSVNHELVKIDQVADVEEASALIIAEVDNVKQDTFYLVKVGEM